MAKIENFFCIYPDISFGLNLSSSSNPVSEFFYRARKAQISWFPNVVVSQMEDHNNMYELLLVVLDLLPSSVQTPAQLDWGSFILTLNI